MAQPLVVGNGLYQQCGNCGQWVRLNKWLFGSLHLCLTEDEIRAHRDAIERQRRATPDPLTALLSRSH